MRHLIWENTHNVTLIIVLLCICKWPEYANASSANVCSDEKPRACEAICTSNKNSCNIRALVLLPDNDKYVASLRGVLPILQAAEQRVKAHGILPSYIKFIWMAQDDKCDAAYAMIKAMDGIVKKCAHVIFGPVCDYPLAAVSRITKYFNSQGTPLITVGGSTYDFEQKKTNCTDEFYMLLRAGMLSFETISELTIAIMKRYNWRHSIFFYDRDGQQNVAGRHTCFLMMNSLGKQMRKENMTFAQYPLNRGINNRTREIRNEIGNKQSIVIMCADPQSIRQIMLTAEELNMIDSGEYVFINIELFSRVPHITSQPWFDKTDTPANNERARKAYTAMLTVTPKQPNDSEYIRVSNEIKTIAAAKYNYTFHENEPISAFVTSFFDGVLLYANALNDSLKEDPTLLSRPINGTDMVRRMWNRTFNGITGNVTIDANGDRISAYSLLDMNPTTGHFEIVAHFLHNRLEYVPNKVIHWAGNRKEPPPDRPTCGFDGSLCPDNSLPGYAILSIVLGIMVIIMTIFFFLGYRHYKSESEINSMSWKVLLDDVIFHDVTGRIMRGGSFHSLVKQSSQWTLISEDIGSFTGDRQIFIPVGVYKNSKVAIKLIDEQNINLTRSLMLELKRMKDLQHDHLVKFYGACLDPAKSFLLTEYCPKGSLQDILENEQFQLDWMFRLSLIHDIVRGMQFLHSSDIKSHGNLKSSNCVVDSRFILKITDFGLHSLRNARFNKGSDVENCNSHAYWSQFLWTAPELLKMEDDRPPEGTQKGDIYSFGIIVHEITTRQGPFYLGNQDTHKSPQEIIQLVKGYPHLIGKPFRPQIDSSDSAYADINALMTKCWSEDQYERPDFNVIKTIIRKVNKDNETGNIVDNLLKRMEQYANNLEELVEERTQDYLEEKKKCEKLLYQLLPQSVAAQLIRGQPVVAETFDQVTIYFSDIVGFTAISAESTPMQVVQFLNDLYTCFDSIVENFDVYKVETIGDAYMVVSGLPIRNGNQHAREIARMALALLEAVHNFRIHHRPADKLKLRIGLHTGACVAGVVGSKMPRYCLFGDTVNTASRMESNGEALKIHISENTKQALDEFGTFITTQRGYVPVKGKGEMLTYWLEGEMPRTESPVLMERPLNRRASVRQAVYRYEQSKLLEDLPPYNERQPSICAALIDNGRRSMGRASMQNSPNLRAKRKFSCSSPKLNDSFDSDLNNCVVNNKTEPATNYMDLFRPNGKTFDRLNANKARDNDIRSARNNDNNNEKTNFRLPLSGALKNHNSNMSKISLNPLLPSISSSNLSSILYSNANTKNRCKMQTPKLCTPLGNSDTTSLYSGYRIKFNINEKPAAEAVKLSSTSDDFEHVSTTPPLLENTHASMRNKLQFNCEPKSSHLKSDDVGKTFTNIVLANNVKNFKLLSNSLVDKQASATTPLTNGSSANTNAATQPLLAKINS